MGSSRGAAAAGRLAAQWSSYRAYRGYKEIAIKINKNQGFISKYIYIYIHIFIYIYIYIYINIYLILY